MNSSTIKNLINDPTAILVSGGLDSAILLADMVNQKFPKVWPVFVQCGLYWEKTELEYLKRFGYKTFDKWIDESYDNEPDDDKRMDMVIEEVKRLTALSDEEWQRMIVEMIPTLHHNFDTLCRAKSLVTANLNYSAIFKNGDMY